MKLIKFDTKPSNILYTSEGKWFINLDIKPEYTEEIKFKNSAFVKTGRLVPTGSYTALNGSIGLMSNKLKFFYQLEEAINNKIDKFVHDNILKGFVWNGYTAWLSDENQQNFASWLNAAKVNSSILPLTAKFNINGGEILYDFSSVEELEDFYTKMVKHINNCVNEGRRIKKNFKDNLVLYKDAYKSLTKV